MINIPRLPPDSFDWIRWRNFSLFYDMDIIHRTYSIRQNKARFADKAIGYCRGGELFCRPKQNHFAVMFLHNDIWQWCHFTAEEFHALFDIA